MVVANVLVFWRDAVVFILSSLLDDVPTIASRKFLSVPFQIRCIVSEIRCDFSSLPLLDRDQQEKRKPNRSVINAIPPFDS